MKVVVAVGTYDSTVICLDFDPDQNRLQRKFQCEGHSGSVKTVASTRQWLASGSTDETIKVFDLIKCCEIGSLLHHKGSISWLTFDGDRMFSASEDGTIAVWQVRTWNCIHTLTGHKGPVSCVAVHQSGKLALSVGRDRILRTWNLSDGHLVFRQKLKEAAQLVKWSPCGGHYVLAFTTTIEVYSVESGVIISTIILDKEINSFIFTQDDVIAVASESPVILMFSIPSGKCSCKLKGHTQRVKGLAVWEQHLFSVSSDCSVRVWKLVQPLKASMCVGVYDTGCRLNCITLSPTEMLKKEAVNAIDDDQKLQEKSKNQENTASTQKSGIAEKGSWYHRYRTRKHRALSQRLTGLPFSHPKRKSARRYRQKTRLKMLVV